MSAHSTQVDEILGHANSLEFVRGCVLVMGLWLHDGVALTIEGVLSGLAVVADATAGDTRFDRWGDAS